MPRYFLPILILLFIIVAVLSMALAQEPAVKYVTRGTIESAEGHPKIRMDCVDGRKWASNVPVRVIAIYTEGDGQREEEVDMMPGIDSTHITLHVPPEVSGNPALQGLRLLYELSGERCESGYGPGVFTQ